jgi:hypothetical protein
VFLNLNTFKAVKSTSSFFLEAGCHVEFSDEALGVVNATVLLADAHVFYLRSGEFLGHHGNVVVIHKAFEGTETTSLVAGLNIVGLNETFAHVQATISLAGKLLSISVSSEVIIIVVVIELS